MSFDRYVENSWLRRESSSAQEIADQMGIVNRSMADAAVDQISDDLRFYTTFNAILALATTALRASGYRMTNQYGHHARLIETLEFSIGDDARTLRKLQAFSRKRNAASYDSAGRDESGVTRHPRDNRSVAQQSRSLDTGIAS